MDTFDYIIVGAGTAGCLLANRLSADASVRVLLLEAGGADDYMWIHIPVGYLYCIGNPRTDWLYKTEPEAGLHGRQLLYPRGKVLGGSSSINGMIYMRGQRQDYDGWAAQGCDGWDWASVLPIFKRSEDHHGGASAFHGGGNELRVERQRLSWAILDAFRAAAAEAGIPSVDDFNTGDNFGCGYFEVNQKRGVRWNAAKAFLKPVRHRRNLTVLTQAHVQHLDLQDGTSSQHGQDGQGSTGATDPAAPAQRCTGLTVRIGQQVQRFQAAREVILAAGAVNTPAILERSGIGDPAHLQRMRIAPRVHLPGVGENLQDHLQLRLAFKVRGVPTLNAQAGSLWGKAWMGTRYMLHRSGPLSMAPSQLGCFARTASSPARANVEYHVQPLSLDRFGEPLHSFPAFTASVCDLQPTSRGSIHIAQPDADTPPRIEPRYLCTPEDRRTAAEAIRLTRHIVSQPALGRYRPEEFMPGPALQSEEELVEAAGRIGTTIFHPVGTCRMGPAADERTVVTPDLKVRGVRGLRVADASVMPTITSGNTNAPTTMIAEKAAAMLVAERVRQPAA